MIGMSYGRPERLDTGGRNLIHWHSSTSFENLLLHKFDGGVLTVAVIFHLRSE